MNNVFKGVNISYKRHIKNVKSLLKLLNINHNKEIDSILTHIIDSINRITNINFIFKIAFNVLNHKNLLIEKNKKTKKLFNYSKHENLLRCCVKIKTSSNRLRQYFSRYFVIFFFFRIIQHFE